MGEVNKEAIAEWVAALRSGNYEQTDRRLVKGTVNQDSYSYCCLGVACDLFGPKVGLTFDRNALGYRDKEFLSTMTLPRSVCEFLGVADNPAVITERVIKSFDESDYLASLNDDGVSFAQIADYIENTFLKGDDNASE